MPKEINPDAAWKEKISVPRDGEGIDAADVELPMSDLLSNDKSLRQQILELSAQVAELKRGQGSFDLLAPVTLAAEPGRSYPASVGIGRYGGFAEPVALTAEGLPAA